DDAVLQALDEFGDANVLADDLTRPRHQQFRRRIMQTGFATAALAACAALAVVYFTPTNRQGHSPQTPAIADSTNSTLSVSAAGDATVTAHDKERGITLKADRIELSPSSETSPLPFVYLTGLVKRPGAYTLPSDRELTLRQLLATAGGFDDSEAHDAYTWVEVRRHASDHAETIHRVNLGWQLEKGRPLTLEPGDVIDLSDQQRPLRPAMQTEVFDLNDLIDRALQRLADQPGNADNVPSRRDLLASTLDQLDNILRGHGYEYSTELGTLSEWMGTLTVVGTPEVIATVRDQLVRWDMVLDSNASARHEDAASTQEKLQQAIVNAVVANRSMHDAMTLLVSQHCYAMRNDARRFADSFAQLRDAGLLDTVDIDTQRFSLVPGLTADGLDRSGQTVALFLTEPIDGFYVTGFADGHVEPITRDLLDERLAQQGVAADALLN
ncbi:MAG: SLBB domain-containing protein, partial [Acidobacteriota bacterium]